VIRRQALKRLEMKATEPRDRRLMSRARRRLRDGAFVPMASPNHPLSVRGPRTGQPIPNRKRASDGMQTHESRTSVARTECDPAGGGDPRPPGRWRCGRPTSARGASDPAHLYPGFALRRFPVAPNPEPELRRSRSEEAFAAAHDRQRMQDLAESLAEHPSDECSSWASGWHPSHGERVG
jgi:hypothetical protein